ncbi:ATP-dependent DNA helicase [Renibacterium salmoninarum ATCC 33209]|uniref:ATP-dependent DNA helicase n=1 Tax=Renibacterium salmoninarum (strain ATCC 33209 / DSM 20767 / JCM 11484 / NBRC 15589 / NCIMB 2235) TaxID=288705 RepID=A9WSH1_RENSM|nr:DEAD/DEAH box helicase [Renibacterium salmoninarum]ABY23759.1 ATP-dependent DNA helicase [Renibacterium salmoninarum ATCC 33209]
MRSQSPARSDDSGTQSPAERFQAARQRQAESRTDFAAFRETFDFPLDQFQTDACTALESGRGVLVAAPTGAGKTIVGEFAVYLALSRGLKAFYTTPIKALSNQKYSELSAKYGTADVGLLTGDSSINPEASIVVMTTEVLRNMLYAGSEALDDLAFVIMDEVHYLADRFRGAVWEEVIIHLPSEVQVVSLSATVSNAEEFGAWLDTVRGSTDIIVSEHRPVPLWQHVMVGKDIVDLFAGDTSFDQLAVVDKNEVPAVNTELLQLARTESENRLRGRFSHGRGRKQSGGKQWNNRKNSARQDAPQSPGKAASRAQVILALDRADLLPAIYFIFSRAVCDAAVRQCVDAGLMLTTEAERQEITARIGMASEDIPSDDLDVLGFWSWRDGMLRGVAAHHAGMLPTFKEVVESLFADGLVRAVFATETLALGVNMPARSVVLEKLEKFNGEAHVNVSAGEYTQLTGRAGRRGIDIEGHAVVLWQPGTDPGAVAGLALRRTYPLNSSFRPTYNMSINLIAQFGRSRAHEILESSFAQFQADRSVVGLARQVSSREEALAGYQDSMTCHLGDFAEYSRLRRELSDVETAASKQQNRARRGIVDESLARLRAGDVIEISAGRMPGFAVVLNNDTQVHEPRPTVLTEGKETRRINRHDLDGPVTPIKTLRIPKQFDVRQPKDRKDLVAALRHAIASASPMTAPPVFGDTRQAEQEAKIALLRRKLRGHPCHSCSDREAHARWSERWWKLRSETDVLVRKIQGRTGTIAKTFDRVCAVLEGYGFLESKPGGELRPSQDGQRLRRIYGEKDLLIALCIREGALADLDAVELAAFASALVYQAKREERGLRPRMPSPSIDAAIDIVVQQWSALEDQESQSKLPLTSEPELGLVWPMFKWARGRHLEAVLEGTDLAAGDFFRWTKQVIDLLDQLASVPGLPIEIRSNCVAAIERVRRGVVAYSSLA